MNQDIIKDIAGNRILFPNEIKFIISTAKEFSSSKEYRDISFITILSVITKKYLEFIDGINFDLEELLK